MGHSTHGVALFAPANREKLDSQNVSLENVIVKENESVVIGTVKVRNLSFQKEVIVRSTWDNWKTQQDTICTYTPVYIHMEHEMLPSSMKMSICAKI